MVIDIASVSSRYCYHCSDTPAHGLFLLVLQKERALFLGNDNSKKSAMESSIHEGKVDGLPSTMIITMGNMIIKFYLMVDRHAVMLGGGKVSVGVPQQCRAKWLRDSGGKPDKLVKSCFNKTKIEFMQYFPLSP